MMLAHSQLPATVYALRSTASGLTKIGYTQRTPSARLRDLTSAERAPCVVEATFDAVVGLERELHQLCARFREHGEWFRLPDEVLGWLRTLSDEPPFTIAIRRRKSA